MYSTVPNEATTQDIVTSTTELIELEAPNLVIALAFIFGSFFVGFVILGIFMCCRDVNKNRSKKLSKTATELNLTVLPDVTFSGGHIESSDDLDHISQYKMHVNTISVENSKQNKNRQYSYNRNIRNKSETQLQSNEMLQNARVTEKRYIDTRHEKVGCRRIHSFVWDGQHDFYQARRADSPFSGSPRRRSMDSGHDTPPELRRAFPMNPVFKDSDIFYTGQGYYPVLPLDPKGDVNTNKANTKLYQQRWV